MDISGIILVNLEWTSAAAIFIFINSFYIFWIENIFFLYAYILLPLPFILRLLYRSHHLGIIPRDTLRKMFFYNI